MNPIARNVLINTVALLGLAWTMSASPSRLSDAITHARSSEGSRWVSWSVPIADSSVLLCCSTDPAPSFTCRLADENHGFSSDDSREMQANTLRVFARFDHGTIALIRMFSDACLVDASGETVDNVGEIDAGTSVSALAGWLDRSDRIADAALGAIAMHAGPAAELAVEKIATSAGRMRLRRSALFWLGRTGGVRGFDVVRRFAWGDGNDELIESAVFSLSQCREAGATAELVALARKHPRGKVRGKALFWLSQKGGPDAVAVVREAALSDGDSHVRKQAVFAASQIDEPESTDLLVDLAKGQVESDVRRDAIFWLGQKAGKTIGRTLRSLVDDPDREIRERAVFAISQRPEEESIPILADLARHHRDAAVRKKALFWLGQKDDPRVVDVFAEILGTKR